MSFPFSREDVRRHLHDLGYKDVGDPQLDDFIQDLRRLIRHEERQKRRAPEGAAGRAASATRLPAPPPLRESPSSSSSAYGSSDSVDAAAAAETEPKRRVVATRSAADIRGRKVAKYRHQGQQPQQDEASPRRRRAHSLSSTRSSANSSSMTEAEVLVRVLGPDQDQPPGPSGVPRFTPKPTTSFIRPRDLVAAGAPRRDLRCDPVRLHQYYQRLWQKTKFPGDESSKATRWAVREWMLGGGPAQDGKRD